VVWHEQKGRVVVAAGWVVVARVVIVSAAATVEQVRVVFSTTPANIRAVRVVERTLIGWGVCESASGGAVVIEIVVVMP
jgi:hypothetical protein